MSKLERKITPIGEAKWAHVHVAKEAFKDKSGREQGEPKFQIDVVFSKDDLEWQAWAKELMAMVKAILQQMDKRTGQVIPHQVPIKRELDQNDKPTGNFYVTFKTGAKFKPGVFNKFGQPIPETQLIGNGSKVRVNYSPSPYEGFGGGVALYLNAVQVVELVEYKAQTADGYGFKSEAAPAGDPFADAGQQEPGDDGGGGYAPMLDEDGIPF